MIEDLEPRGLIGCRPYNPDQGRRFRLGEVDSGGETAVSPGQAQVIAPGGGPLPDLDP